MRFPRLSPRQRQIAELLLHAKANKEIANLIGITESAVKHHLLIMRIKLGFDSYGCDRVRLAMYLHEHRRQFNLACSCDRPVAVPAAA